ncbi:MAG TPA: helix-turn-helix domain-containing protein [Pseudomonadales bacterium]|nr:helix-turn-helix domain-containing protein [Pseudomonadales bacterium]
MSADDTIKKNPDVKKRLLEAMHHRGVSITNLAYALGLSKSSVSEWLRGGGLSMNSLAAIALELNISIDWLLMGKGKMDLFGAVHPTEEEMELVYMLRTVGPSTIDIFFNMITNIAKPILGDDPVSQILALDMFEQSRMALCVLSHDGFILDLNEICLRMLGDNIDKHTAVIGTHFMEWLTDEDVPNAMRRIQTGFATGYNTNFNCRIKRKQSLSVINSKPFIDVIINSVFYGSTDEGYFQCIAFPLD